MAEQSVRPLGLPGWRSRVTVLGLLVAVAFIVAGRSLGAVTPHLVVSSAFSGPGQTLTISASKSKADDTVGRIQFYVPTGFALNSPVGGASVGKASAKVIMRDIDANTEQSWTGSVIAIAPDEAAVSYEGANCDPNQHLAAWMVQLNGTKGVYSFPIFVDPGTTFGPYVLVACFRPWDVAADNPNRSPNGNIVDSFTLKLTPFVRPAEVGAYRWRSLWTPFSPGTGALNTAGNVEAQSVINLPAGQVVIFGKKTQVTVHGKTLNRLLISGQVLVNSEPIGPVVVTIRHGVTKTKLNSLGSVKTGSDGGYTKTVTLLKKTQFFTASTNIPASDLGAAGCQASFGTVPCVDETSGAGHSVSGIMLIKS